ncbi:MAG TPA: aminotransferase class V-fold PLP-dependent enzyme [candidate division Zixibacteria bacterium]|nr:aminotransferase class V-fold PLP-dependent enzyme [candidate division Zixibacteria bacterium]
MSMTSVAAPGTSKKISISDLPGLLIGSDTTVPTLHGPMPYINFDNAASTPTFLHIASEVTSFLRWYSNVHRGTGFKSLLSSWAFEQSRDIVADFVGADLSKQVVIFTKNSTEAINKLANRFPFRKNDVILTTLMEHHSNELPWRRVGFVEHIGLNADGTISKEDFQAKLKQFGPKVKLVAITGASNVTGYVNDIDYFARETHKAGARIMIDAAQLVPHRPIDMKPNDPEHKIDFLVFSAHKMYAPFGVGVLIAERPIFEQGDPETVGGGVVDIVTLEEAYWTELPEKEEAGTPDIVGVVALAKAIRMFQQVGWDAIINHEADLTSYALTELKKIPGVTLYGDTDPANALHRLGVISLNIGSVPHALAAAVLSYEGAIGVRSGCFCAHTYVKCLLNVSSEASRTLENQILARDRSSIPGTIRMSFGIYNTKEEIDRFVKMVSKIASGDYSKDYVLNKEKGEYTLKDFTFDFGKYYSL